MGVSGNLWIVLRVPVLQTNFSPAVDFTRGSEYMSMPISPFVHSLFLPLSREVFSLGRLRGGENVRGGAGVCEIISIKQCVCERSEVVWRVG